MATKIETEDRVFAVIDATVPVLVKLAGLAWNMNRLLRLSNQFFGTPYIALTFKERLALASAIRGTINCLRPVPVKPPMTAQDYADKRMKNRGFTTS